MYQLFVSPSESLAVQVAEQSCEQSYKQRWSVCLIYTPEEAMSVPEFLRCEMYRGGLGTYTSYGFLPQRHRKEDNICLQIEPYLYYLQYLTYNKLHQERKQSEALTK
ncbi:hypothetical protein DPMN_161861 [Dreissena polymorpha]|uniref:Uncharacterized protein n=1 Tax=Dreissena polymorpha TaxID=45954 RepID=A0A9D4ESW6_DREPO|nr:hypothetical protein DPMN_161861 [Dreissena polymorpha]